jgi:regulator of protease activity HflC (stomatin/prohibitin superfamily)
MSSSKTLVKMVSIGLVASALALATTGCNRIEPGWVGIKVNQAGSAKGVEDYPLQTGWVLYMPGLTKVYEYPTFQQNVIWCASLNEGRALDESISFNCKGGAAIVADVSMSGKFKIEKVPFIFVKFRTEPSLIVHGYLRNEVRDALGRIASTYDPMDVIGDKRGEFLDALKKEVDSRVGDWWVVDYITFANKLRMDPRIEQSINTIIEQKQQTAASELKVKQTKAEADQQVAKSEGEARSKKALAEGEAQAILAKAKAQAEANTLLTQSMTQMLLQYDALQKWDGKLPTITTGSGVVPFINVGGVVSTNR